MTSRTNLQRAVLAAAIAGFAGWNASVAHAISSTWTTNGNWSTIGGGVWSAGIPTATGDIANYTAANASATLTVDSPRTVGQILFGGAGGTAMSAIRIWSIANVGTNLTLDNGGAASSVAGVNGALIQNFNTNNTNTTAMTSGRFEITGGTITLNDNLTIINRNIGNSTTTSGPHLLISSIIAGNKNITFGNTVGAAYAAEDSSGLGNRGAVSIQGANTFTGNVSIPKGKVVTNNAAAFGNPLNVITMGDPAVNTGISVQANVNIPNPIQTIANTGNTSIIGTQVANPTAAGEFSGAITVNTGSTIAVSSVSSTSLTLPLATEVGLTVSGVISGPGGLEKTGGNANANKSVGSATIPGDANTYTGQTGISRGQLRVHSIGSVGGSSSSLGAPTTVANGTIVMGSFGSGLYTALTYFGAGETTNRNFDLQQAAGTTAAILAAGTGALTITGNVDTSFNAVSKTFNLAGSNTGSNAISGSIKNSSGTLNLTKTDAGNWLLSGNNGYAGTTTVSAGTLQIGHANALGNMGLVNANVTGETSVTAGATLDLNGQSGVNEAITLNGTGVGTNGALINNSGTAATLSTGIAQLALTTGGSGYSAPPTVSISGTGTGAAANALLGLTAASVSSIPSGGTGYFTGDIITFTGGGATVPATASITAGSGSITAFTIINPGSGYTSAPTGFTTASGLGSGASFNTNATNFTVSALQVTNNGSGYTTAPTVGFSSGAAASTATISSVALATASSIGGSGNTTINSIVSGSSLTKVGAGTLTLGGVNTYIGDTTISGGTLKLSSTGSIDTTPAIDVKSGATFDVSAIGGGYTLPSSATLKGVGSITGSITSASSNTIAPGASAAAAGTLTFNSGNLTLGGSTMQYDLSNSPGGMNDKIVGVSALALSGNITFNFNAPSGVGVGSYQLINAGSLSGTPSWTINGLSTGTTRQTVGISTTTVANTVTLDVVGVAGNLLWKGNNGNNWNINTTVNWTGAPEAIPDNHFFDADNVTFDDTATTYTPSVTQDVQPANVTFANTAAHAYNVDGPGSINVGGNFTNGAGQVTIENSGNFGIVGNFVQNASGTTTIKNTGTFTGIGGSITLNGTLNLNINHDITATNTVTGSGAFHKQGTNTVTLSGDGSGFTGSIFVDNGILKAGSTTALGATNVVTTVAGGATLDLNGKDMVGAVITAEGTGFGGSGGGIVNTALASVHRIKGLTLTDDLTIVQNATSIMTMDGFVSSPGAFLHGAGKNLTAKLGPGGAIFGTELNLGEVGDTNLKDITVSGGGTLWIGGNTTLGLNTGTLTLLDRGRLGFYSTSVVNDKPIAVHSSATVAEIATYGSSTTLNSPVDIQGTQLQAITRPTSAGTIALTLGGALTGPGGLAAHDVGNSAHTLIGVVALTSDANTYAGPTFIGGGSSSSTGIYTILGDRDIITLSVGNGGATGSIGAGDITVLDAGVLQFNRSGSLSVPNNITGTGRLTSINPGAEVTLTGATLDYTGTTTVSGGKLLVNSTYSGGGAFTVISGATLGGTGSISSSLVTVNTGGILSPGASIESLDITGDTTINGKLKIEYQGTSFDLLNVSGILDITNATLDLINLGGSPPAGTYVFATYGSLTGNPFPTINNLSGYTIDYAFGGNNIALVVPAGAAGDYNGNGVVDAADYVVWRKNLGLTGSPTVLQGNGDGDNDVDNEDYNIWRANFGAVAGSGSGGGLGGSSAVPEPTGLLLMLVAVVGTLAAGRRR